MSFSDELPNPTAELAENKEWKQKLKSGANRLSVELFKMKQTQYYDRRPSSVDATTWYSAGSSISGSSVAGGAASANYNYSSGVSTRRGSGAGLIGTTSTVGQDDDPDDPGEVSYSSARLSLIAGIPSPACGGGYEPYGYYQNTSESGAYEFQQTLVERLYGYEIDEVDPMGLSDTPPSAEEILLSSKVPRNTSIFRSFEGWGFDAEEVYNMDPIEEKENEPGVMQTSGFRFDSSIRKAAYSENLDKDASMTGVDPLDLMDTGSRTLVESHPLPIPARLSLNMNSSRKRSSQISFMNSQHRKRRVSSLHSMHGHSRQHSRQYSNARSSVSSGLGEGHSRSPYRPSIVLTEIPIFDFSESEPNTRNGSRNGSIFVGREQLGRGSVGSTASRRSSKISKMPATGTKASNGHPDKQQKQGKKSIFGFLSRKQSKPKSAPTSQARAPDTHFVPLLHDITEVDSISSREATPEILTAKETPILKVEKAPGGKPRMLPVPRPDHAMRRASVTLQVSDEDVFDNLEPVMAHRERRSSSVYSQHELLPFRAGRRSSSVYEGDMPEPALRVRRNSSVYDIDDMQPGEEPSPPMTPFRRYSENHLSHPDVYIPPRANWYKSDWGLDDNAALDADARSIRSNATGPVKAVLSRQPSGSRRGSVDQGSTPESGTPGYGFNPGRRQSTDERMADLSIALRNALKMNDIQEEDEVYA